MIPESDDVVIDVMTQQMMFEQHENDGIDIFAVTDGCREKAWGGPRQENDRESDRVFDILNRETVDKSRVMCARRVPTWKTGGKAKTRLCFWGVSRPRLDRSTS